MIRLLLPACLALAAIPLFQSDLSASSYQAQMSGTRLAQDDSAQAPAPSTAPDPGSSEEPADDESGKSDQE